MKFARTTFAFVLLDLVLIGLMLALALGSCSHARAATPTADKYTAAFDRWATADKPLVIFYTQPGCGPCVVAERAYLAELNNTAIVVKLDLVADRWLIEKHKLPAVKQTPTLVCYPPRAPYHHNWHPHWYDPRYPGPWPRLFIGLPGFKLFLGR